MTTPHLISISDLSPAQIQAIVLKASQLKKSKKPLSTLKGKTVSVIFEKPSTRTSVSFAAGIHSLGGLPLIQQSGALQWGRGESIADMARVMSRYVAAIVVRARRHEDVLELSKYSTVPVINGLTDLEHPCQVLGDILTLWERSGRSWGRMRKMKYVFLGDGNNVAQSWILLSGLMGFHFVLACPNGYDPDPSILRVARQYASKSGARIGVIHDPQVAVRGADMLYTDVWTSMGQESEESKRRKAFKPFQINGALLELAKPNAMVLHCLPAKRGEEITADVIDGPQSIVFDQAENRLHIQKAILMHLLG